MNYRIEGDGPPLLLIHGFGISYNIWKNLAPWLARDFQLVMIEFPGLGNSPLPQPEQPYFERCAEEVERLRQRLGIERWALLCYSMGARVGETYLARWAGHASRVAYLCPVHTDWLKANSLRAALRLDRHYPSGGDWILSGWRLAGLVRLLGFNGQAHPYAQEWYQEIAQQPLPALRASLRGLPGGGHAPLKPVPVPSLFIWGRQDLIVTYPRRPRPNDILISAGHSAPVLAAAQIAEIAVPFLRAIP